ncbi:hypothetical protein JVY00_04155 [Tsukamurella tyrosinosolvens]|uniref:hypothetical protein n=1 Tax=Tsukamurella tyrosinosolvens TaxID=57704 RepID=UPI001AF87495|nr:hypothetical protein JVY00_04155 [Tsukamurella tyrosinosolvens]
MYSSPSAIRMGSPAHFSLAGGARRAWPSSEMSTAKRFNAVQGFGFITDALRNAVAAQGISALTIVPGRSGRAPTPVSRVNPSRRRFLTARSPAIRSVMPVR